MWTNIKLALRRFIPSHVNDPVGLIWRMLTSGKKAAPFTLWLTGVSILATPLDWVLQCFEARTRRKFVRQPNGPHIFICGPARSGTTLVYQVLASNLDVAYVRNFTAAFSRSPVLASRMFTRKTGDNQSTEYSNYYGKTAGWQSPSEANHLWNVWVDEDASEFRTILSAEGATNMVDFLNSFSASENKPTLTKNNNANAFANDISESLDNAYFICMTRETKYLAQSLLKARMEINGDITKAYGVRNSITDTQHTNANSLNANNAKSSDPVDQVLAQIDYLNNLASTQQKRIGKDRFWIVDYEEFCNDPAALLQRVKSQILGIAEQKTSFSMAPIRHNNRTTNANILNQIERRLNAQLNNKPESNPKRKPEKLLSH